MTSTNERKQPNMWHGKSKWTKQSLASYYRSVATILSNVKGFFLFKGFTYAFWRIQIIRVV
jgi:hypothetical protein